MSKETEDYRPILESILKEYGKHCLSTEECMQFTGHGREWLKNHLGITGGGATAERLAMRLSKM